MQTLKTITKTLKLNNKEIANHCGVSYQAVMYWIRGQFMPRTKHKAKIMELSKDIITEEHFTNSWNEYQNKNKKV